jgi:tetratricopeptide (TPR) repeat protein
MPTHTSSTKRALLLIALGVAAPGCRTLSREPVSQSVATCRQLTQQGTNAKERGDWKRAESLLGRAVQSCAIDADARRNYAETLWHRGARGEALAQLKEARRLAGEDPGLAVRTGEMHLALGHVGEANQMADEALQLDPKFASAWALRGRVSAAAGQTQAALADYQRALGYGPHDEEIPILVAEAYRQLNQPQRALGALQSLAEHYTPGQEPQQVLYLEGLALTALNRYDDASQILAQAARRNSPSAEILFRLAEAELLAGRVSNAQTTLEQSLALDPDHRPSRVLAGRIALAAPAGQTITR